MKLGLTQTLKVKEINEHGAVLVDENEKEVLLPGKEAAGLTEDDQVDVFIYRDSEDRLVATTSKPKIKLGEIKPLKAVQNTKIGAFLDWGLDKDLLLPFSEQLIKIEPGKEYLVRLYEDKSGRLAASTKVYDYLERYSPYKKGDWVEGYVYQINPKFGAFIAVDNKYSGMVRKEDMNNDIRNGKTVRLRVVDVTKDGKLTLSPVRRAHKEILPDAKKLLLALRENHGFIPFNDKSDPADIRREFNMSKAAFKKALGLLLKNRLVVQTEDGIRRTNVTGKK